MEEEDSEVRKGGRRERRIERKGASEKKERSKIKPFSLKSLSTFSPNVREGKGREPKSPLGG